MTVNIPCDCKDEEHEVPVSGEYAGLYEPAEGDVLPGGRLVDKKDMEYVWDYLNNLDVDEG